MTLSLNPIIKARTLLGEAERKYFIALNFRRIIRAWRQGKLMPKSRYINTDNLEERLEEYASIAGLSWPECWIKSINTELGDPHLMQLCGLKHHSKIYWNPTNYHLKINSLGIGVNEVLPGATVAIPWGYTIGGKRSAILSIAPQLRPMPTSEPDTELDSSPITYLEWCTFYRSGILSRCCHKPILWSIARNHLVCQACEGPEDGK